MTATEYVTAAALCWFLSLGALAGGGLVFALAVLVMQQVERGEREP